MPHERRLPDRDRCELIARRLPTFAYGWLGVLAFWLGVFALEGRVGRLAVGLVAGAVIGLWAAARLVRAAPTAPRVLPIAVATCVGLGVVAIGLVEAAGGYAEVLAFLLLTLYLLAALLFAWGWRAELVLLAATLVPWLARIDGLQRFVPLPELGAAVAIGAALALGVAEGGARSLRQVSRRRRAQLAATRALRASHDAYRDLAEQAPDLIWTADLEGRFTYVNPPLARFLGVSADDLLGRAIDEFFTGHPENPDFAAALARMLAGDALPPTPVECPTPSGPRWVEVTAALVRDAAGAPTGLRGISRDVQVRRTSEAALRTSEARYRGLVESQLEMIVRLDTGGRFVFVNDAYAAALGVARERLLGEPFMRYVDPEDHAIVAQGIAGFMRPPHRVVMEIRNLTPAGPRWVAWEGGLVIDASGNVLEAQAVGRDVTERHEAEEALRASEARYRGLVEGAQDAVTRFAIDGRLTFANDAYCAAIGCAREDIVGRNPLFLVHPDDRDATLAAVREVLRPPYRCRVESRGQTTRGMRWYEWEMSAVHGDDGRVVEIQQVGRDVTTRREAEHALRESEERFRSAFEDAGIGMGITNTDGTALRVNPAFCAMFGYAEHELVGRTLYELVDLEDRAMLAADQHALMSGATRMYRAERRYRRKDGTTMWTIATASLVRDAAGAPLYVVGQLEDITERHMAEEALRASIVELRRSEEKLRLLAQRQVAIREEERKRVGFDLHDDVCQELVGVGILVESLRRKVGPASTAVDAEFERVVRYLGEVVEHLRLLARELRPLLLRDLGLDGSFRSLVDGMTSATTSVRVELAAPVPRLDEDTELTVYRIAQEALTNAVRHACAQTVVIRLGIADEALVLAVSDDGRGFDPAARPAAALGLASMEERALALGGRLDVRSAPGAGTTIALTCPLDVRGSRRVREPAGSSPTRSSSRPSAATTPRAAARD